MDVTPRTPQDAVKPTILCRVPARQRASLLYRLPSGDLMTATAIWMTAGAWSRRPEASAPGWLTLRLGPFTLALRFEI